MKRRLSQGTLQFSSSKTKVQAREESSGVKIRPPSNSDATNTKSISPGKSIFTKLMNSARIHAQVDSFWLYEENSHWFWQWLPEDSARSKRLRDYSCFWNHNVSLRGIHGWGKTHISLKTNIPSYSPGKEPSWKPREPSTRLSMSLLKSCLQKAIRRGLSDVALQLSTEIWCRDPLELIRRLQIISIEDCLLHPAQPVLAWLMMANSSASYSFSSKHFYLVLSFVQDLCKCPFQERIPSKLPKLDAVQALVNENDDEGIAVSSCAPSNNQASTKHSATKDSQDVLDLTSEEENKLATVAEKGLSTVSDHVSVHLPPLVTAQVPSREIVENLAPVHAAIIKALYARMEYGGMAFDKELLTKIMHVFMLRFFIDEQRYPDSFVGYEQILSEKLEKKDPSRPIDAFGEHKLQSEHGAVMDASDTPIWQKVTVEGMPAALKSAHQELCGSDMDQEWVCLAGPEAITLPKYKTWLNLLCFCIRASSLSLLPVNCAPPPVPDGSSGVDFVLLGIPNFTRSLWHTYLVFGSHYYVTLQEMSTFRALEVFDIPLAGVDYHSSDIITATLAQAVSLPSSSVLPTSVNSVSIRTSLQKPVDGAGSLLHRTAQSREPGPKLIVIQPQRNPQAASQAAAQTIAEATLSKVDQDSLFSRDQGDIRNFESLSNSLLRQYCLRLRQWLYSIGYPVTVSIPVTSPTLPAAILLQLKSLLSEHCEGNDIAKSKPTDSVGIKKFNIGQLQRIMWDLRSGVNYRNRLSIHYVALKELSSKECISSSKYIKRLRNICTVPDIAFCQAGLFNLISDNSFPKRSSNIQPLSSKHDFAILFAAVLQIFQTWHFVKSDDTTYVENWTVSHTNTPPRSEALTDSVVDNLVLRLYRASNTDFAIFQLLHSFWDVWSLKLISDRC